MSHIAPWFPNAKLGIFVHWGVFGTMFAEQEEREAKSRSLSPLEYQRRAELFTCEHFDMADWAGSFQRWGARYAVLTARHAQGFALWDTKVDNRSIVRMSPYGKDVVSQWVRELRNEDMKVGLYFGHRDWGDRDFRAVMDGEEFREKDPVLREVAWKGYLEKRDRKITELLENYGKIDLFWLDEDWGRTHEQLRCESLIELIEKKQPGIVVNNRFCHPHIGHYATPEQYVPLSAPSMPWEVCDTLVESNHWQFLACERKYKRAEDVIRFFIDILTTGGNYLINIGPSPDGKIPEDENAILDKLGSFCHKNSEAIYGTAAGLPRSCFGGGSTVKGNALYLFAVDKLRGELVFRGLKNPITRVSRLGSSESLDFRLSGGRPSHGRPGYVWIDAPEENHDMPIVYKVEFEGKRLEISEK